MIYELFGLVQQIGHYSSCQSPKTRGLNFHIPVAAKSHTSPLANYVFLDFELETNRDWKLMF